MSDDDKDNEIEHTLINKDDEKENRIKDENEDNEIEHILINKDKEIENQTREDNKDNDNNSLSEKENIKDDEKKKEIELIFKNRDYNKEKEFIINNEKKSLIEDLNTVSTNINKYKTVRDFLLISRKKSKKIMPEITSERNKCFICFNLRVIGVIFMTLYITGLYIYIGLKDSIMEEIKVSAKIYLFNSKRVDNSTFFDIYKKTNIGTPKFSLYFITSSFSGFMFNCMGIYLQTIIVLIFNTVIIIGLYLFEFHIKEDNINEAYSFIQFFYLLVFYILLYSFTGIISMLPHTIFFSAFDQYEKWKEKRKKGFPHIYNDDKEKEEKEDGEMVYKDEIKGDYNGLFLGFFISILASMALKNILNEYLIIKFLDRHLLFYVMIVGCSLIPIILALLFYCCFSKIFNPKKKEEKSKEKTFSGCRLCGYLFYIEEEPNPNDIKCGAIRKAWRKCYFNCYLDCLCCCCKCLSCEKCCCEEKTFAELSDLQSRDSKICIIYKTTGIMSSICDLITKRTLLACSLVMFLLQIINYGSRKSLSEYLETCGDSKRLLLNILSLLGILFFFILTVVFGYFLVKCAKLEGSGETVYLGYGIIFLAFFGSIVSFIISLLSHYDFISDKIYYLFPFSIGSIEFYLILLKRISSALLRTEFIPFDSLFSFYLIIWDFFAFLLDIFKASSYGLIFAQFIISSIVLPIGLFSTCLFCLRKCITGQEAKNDEQVPISKTKDEIIE